MPRPAWQIRSTRTRIRTARLVSIPSRCRRTARFWWAAISPPSAGSRGTSIARLDATTGLADSFNPNANAAVYAIALQADGKILVGGSFFGRDIGGQSRNDIARLDPTTGLADSFNPNANDVVVLHRGAGGRQDFDAAVFSRASADNAQPTSPDSIPRPAWPIRSIRTRTILSGQSRCRRTARSWRAVFSPASVARRATTSPGSIQRPAWPIRSTRTRAIRSLSIAVQADGKILVGGNFTTVAPNGGATVTRNHIARLETDGTVDQTLNLNAHRHPRFTPPPFRRTARFLSAATLPAFWACHATTSPG